MCVLKNDSRYLESSGQISVQDWDSHWGMVHYFLLTRCRPLEALWWPCPCGLPHGVGGSALQGFQQMIGSLQAPRLPVSAASWSQCRIVEEYQAHAWVDKGDHICSLFRLLQLLGMSCRGIFHVTELHTFRFGTRLCLGAHHKGNGQY